MSNYNKYIIPENYNNSGNFLGKIKLRHFIDMILFGGTVALVEIKFIPVSWVIKFIILVVSVLPICLFCIIGIDGCSVTEYLIRMFSFFVDRRNIRDEEEQAAYIEKTQLNKEQKNEENVSEESQKIEDEDSSDEPNSKKKKKKKKKRKEFKVTLKETTADRIPIEKIENGIIKTTAGEYVKIVEVMPVNFDLLSPGEQNNIIEAFSQMLKIAPVNIQFKVISQQANSKKMVRRMEYFRKKESSDKCKKFIDEYIGLIREIGERQGVSRRFFIIFKFEGFDGNYYKSMAEPDIYNELNTVANSIEGMLKSCGNSVVHHKDEDEAIESLFYELFNRSTATVANYNFKKKYAYNYYLKQLQKEKDERMEKGIDLDTPSEYIAPGLRDNLAPFMMDFSNSKYCNCDGLYYKFMYIDSAGYKINVFSAWLNAIVNAGNGIDLDIFAHKEDKEKIRDKVKRKKTFNRSKFKLSRESASDREQLENAIFAGEYILDAMSSQGEDFYYMSAIITVSGYSIEEVEYKARQIQTYFRSQDYLLRDCKYWQESAFFSVLPLCSIDKEIFEASKRNVLTHGLASTYIFTSLELSDERGVMFGINQLNNSLCFVDNFNLEKYTTPNMFIIGTSGSGKTYSMQQIAMRYRYQNIQTFILAPLKGREYRRAALALGGSFVSISTASHNCINVMEIRDYDRNSTDKQLESEFGELNSSKLALKAQQLGTFFSLVVPDIKSEERQAVDEEIMKTYADFGITTDNRSLYDEDGNLKTMPVLEDLYHRLKQNEYTKRVATIMSRFVTGSAQVFNQQTNVDLTNKYIVFDISDLSKELLPIGMFIVLDFVWDTIKADRTKKKILFLDELWTLIGANSSEYAAEFVLEIFKIIRGYGGVAVAATQDLNDFFALNDGAYGKGIVNQCNNKIVLKLKEEEAKRVQNVLSLNDSEMKEIVNFDRGQAFFIADKTHLTIKFQATPIEHDYITSDREELATIARKRFEKNEKSLVDSENGEVAKSEEELFREANEEEFKNDYEMNASLYEDTLNSSEKDAGDAKTEEQSEDTLVDDGNDTVSEERDFFDEVSIESSADDEAAQKEKEDKRREFYASDFFMNAFKTDDNREEKQEDKEVTQEDVVLDNPLSTQEPAEQTSHSADSKTEPVDLKNKTDDADDFNVVVVNRQQEDAVQHTEQNTSENNKEDIKEVKESPVNKTNATNIKSVPEAVTEDESEPANKEIADDESKKTKNTETIGSKSSTQVIKNKEPVNQNISRSSVKKEPKKEEPTKKQEPKQPSNSKKQKGENLLQSAFDNL